MLRICNKVFANNKIFDNKAYGHHTRSNIATYIVPTIYYSFSTPVLWNGCFDVINLLFIWPIQYTQWIANDHFLWAETSIFLFREKTTQNLFAFIFFFLGFLNWNTRAPWKYSQWVRSSANEFAWICVCDVTFIRNSWTPRKTEKSMPLTPNIGLNGKVQLKSRWVDGLSTQDSAKNPQSTKIKPHRRETFFLNCPERIETHSCSANDKR